MASSETYARVAVTFWSDPEVKRVLSTEQKALLLYYFTSPHSNMVGLYSAPFEFTAALTGLSVASVKEWTLGLLSSFVSYDERTEEVLVHRAARDQVGDTLDQRDKRLPAVRRILADAHSQALASRFAELHPEWPIEAPSKPLPSPFEAIAVTEAVTEQVQKQEGLVVGAAPPSAPTPRDDVQDGPDPAAPSPAATAAHLQGHSYVLECVRAANRAGHANERIPHYREILPGHGSSFQTAAEWEREGIPLDLVTEAISQVASGYNPTGTSKQFNSLTYFDATVRNAFRARAADESAGAGVLALVRHGAPELPAVGGVREVFAGVEEVAERRLAADHALKEAAETVFGYLLAKTGLAGAKIIYDEQRERVIIGALRKNGGDVGEVLYAIDGAVADRWHNGDKDGKKRLRIEQILRDRGTIEELAQSRKGWRMGTEHPVLVSLREKIGRR